MPHYTFLISDSTAGRARSYLSQLQSGGSPGKRLAAGLAGCGLPDLTMEGLIESLLRTKKPCIFAESHVRGDGSDWNQAELALLGDISAAMEVAVFDNGSHTSPNVHPEPFQAALLFTPGALLQSQPGSIPADWNEVTQSGRLDPEAYFRLYERRLLPLLRFADRLAGRYGKRALVTIPGIGCGLFAGKFHGQLGEAFRKVLFRLLQIYGRELPHLAALYYDPYSECDHARVEIHGIPYLVRPLIKGSGGRPQLCRPETYAEDGDDFSDCLLCSFVAWDHVSWPGNDFYRGDRKTDDGVKAAATSAMYQMTGLLGWYDPESYRYQPPPPYRNWEQVVFERNLTLEVAGRLQIL